MIPSACMAALSLSKIRLFSSAARAAKEIQEKVTKDWYHERTFTAEMMCIYLEIISILVASDIRQERSGKCCIEQALWGL